nr:hypothetical protein [Tanacetum cinerariifolium]
MDLFAFIHHADPTKVKAGEREVSDEEVPLLELTKDRIVSLAGVYDRENTNARDAGNENVNEGVNDAATTGHTEQSDHVVDVGGIDIIADDEKQAIVVKQPKKIRKMKRAADGASGSGLPPKNSREDHGTSEEAGASVAVKTLAALQGLLDSSTLVAEVEVKADATVPFVTSFVTPTPEREGGCARDSATGTMLRTQRASERFVVLTDSSHHSGTNAADDEVTSIVRSSMPPPSMLIVAVTTTTIVVGTTSALVHDLGTDQVKPSIFRDSASPSMAEADVVGPSHPVEVEHSGLSNMGSFRQTCFNAEIRMRLEHELRGRKKLEEIYVQQVNWLKEKDTKITSLKAQLSLKKAEAVEAICLRGQIATLKTAEAARINELNDLRERNVALVEHLSCDDMSIKASFFKFEKDRLIDQVSALETTCSGLRDEVMGYKIFKEWVEEMQDELVIMKCLQSFEYLSALGGGIGRTINKGVQDGLAAGINHEKAGRGLADVAAFNPSVESNFVSAVNALGEVDFPILAQLSYLKDASIMDLMDALRAILVTEAPGLVMSMEAPSPSQIVFEKEDIETMPEYVSVD